LALGKKITFVTDWSINWTDIFLAFTHVVVGLIDSCWLKALREHVTHHLNDEYN